MSAALNAAEYPYMAIRQTDGSSVVVKSDGLRFSVNNGVMTISHVDGELTLALADLASMRFSTDDTGVESLVADSGLPVEVYNISGTHIGRYDSVSEAIADIHTNGVYLFKTDKGTAKIRIQ